MAFPEMRGRFRRCEGMRDDALALPGMLWPRGSEGRNDDRREQGPGMPWFGRHSGAIRIRRGNGAHGEKDGWRAVGPQSLEIGWASAFVEAGAGVSDGRRAVEERRNAPGAMP